MRHTLEKPPQALATGNIVKVQPPAFCTASTLPVGPGIVLARSTATAPVWFWAMGAITPGVSVRDVLPSEATIRPVTLHTLPVGALARIAAELTRPHTAAARHIIHPLARATATAAADRGLWHYAAWLCQHCGTRNHVIRHEHVPEECHTCGQP